MILALLLGWEPVCLGLLGQGKEGAQLNLPESPQATCFNLSVLVEHSKIISAGVLWVHTCPMASQGEEVAVLLGIGL